MLFTMDNRGSEIATTSVFDCHLSPVERLMAIEHSVSNYFLSAFIDSIDVFDCRLSGEVSLFCIHLNKIIWNCLCLKGRYITILMEFRLFQTSADKILSLKIFYFRKIHFLI